MAKNNILRSIDKAIITSINNRISFVEICNKLELKYIKMFDFIKKDQNFNHDIDSLLSMNIKNENLKLKYAQTYIYSCRKRYNDINWINKNRYRFKGLSNKELFRLIELKDKLKTK